MNHPEINQVRQEFNQLNLFYLLNHKAHHKDRCIYCHAKLTCLTRSREHIIPRSRLRKGFTRNFRSLSGMINVVPCCESCNKAKQDKTLIEFYELLKRKPLPNRILIMQNIRKLLSSKEDTYRNF